MKKQILWLLVLGTLIPLPAIADESFSLQLSGGAATSPQSRTIYPQMNVDVTVPLLKVLKMGLSGGFGPQKMNDWLSNSAIYSLGLHASAWLPFTGLYAGLRFGGSVLTDPVVGPMKLLDSTTTFLTLNPFLGWELSWIPFVKPGLQVGYYMPIQRSEFNALSSVHLLLSIRLSI